MKAIGIIIMALLTGCAVSGSFQPLGSPVSKAEFSAAIQQLGENDRLLAQKFAEIAPKPKEAKK